MEAGGVNEKKNPKFTGHTPSVFKCSIFHLLGLILALQSTHEDQRSTAALIGLVPLLGLATAKCYATYFSAAWNAAHKRLKA